MAIQYSIQKMVSDGTLSTITLGIQYLQRNDIYIRIAGEDTPQSGAPSGYTWSFINNTTLKILPVVPNGVEVVVYRRTDVDAMYNIYSQNAQFDEATIDENNQQLLYIAQEYLEQGLPGAGVDTIEFLRDDGTNTYCRIKRTDGSYSEEFAVPSAGSITRVLARVAISRNLAAVGINLVAGSFESGASVVNGNDAVLLESTGAAFVRKNGGSFTVISGSNPDSSWVSVGSGLDDIYAFAFGLNPSASAEQNTIALCRALDIANGDYMQPVAHGNGTLARWLYGSVGTFATDPAFLTGVHAQAGKFVVRCNAQLRGRFPNADFMIVHCRDIEVTHINAKSMEIRGSQGGDYRRWRLSGDLIIRASGDRQPSWVYRWDGGTYWNEFANIKCGNPALAGKIIFETSYGSVNANTVRRVSGQLWITRYAGTVDSIPMECHENEIFGIDTSGSQGDPIRNDTPEDQLNTVYGWYDEVTGNGRVFGNWNIVYPRVQFNNWNTTQPEGWAIFTEPKAGQQGGDFVPLTVESAAIGSDWSVIEGSKGLPYCAKANSIAQVYSDPLEPSGSGRSWGLDSAPVGTNLKFDLAVLSSKYVRGTIWIKDTPNLSITQIRVSNSDGTNAAYQIVTKYVVRTGWRLYRVAGVVDPTKPVKVDFNVSGDIRFGGAMFSRSHACPLPLFPGWEKSRGFHNAKPTYLANATGFWFYRDSTASAADPTIAWVRVLDTGSGPYMKINAQF